MKNHLTWTAALSTAAALTIFAPAFSTSAFAEAPKGWVSEEDGFRFYDNDGYYLTDSWKKENGKWYYLDEEGRVAFNRQIDEYYVGDQGFRVSEQWVSIANEENWDDDAPESYWYYYDKNGKILVSRFRTIGSDTFYFNEDGHMVTGQAEVEDASYYFAENGAMQTGWVQMIDENADIDEEISWHYFLSDGKMVENQVDKHIEGHFYTFENGRMVTGWYKLPGPDAEAAATAANAEEAKEASARGYQYYDADGKRASGWMTIQGIPGISEEDETFRFYFKSGKPSFSSTGVQVFSINSNRYAFNTKGEMQTGKQIITLEDGSIANAYFGDDGMMRTGKQTIFNEDTGMNETWFFHTEGSKRGQGQHGIRDNVIYHYGLRQEAPAELRYAPVEFDGKRYLVNASGTIQKASASGKSSERPDLGKGFRDLKDTNDTVWTVDKDGVIQ